jgi:uncharacterized membrane protein
MRPAVALIASVSVLAVMEAIWLSTAKTFYAAMLSGVSSDGALRIRSMPATVLVYALLLAGAWVLVLRPLTTHKPRLASAACHGAVFGATVYGVYNLTNMATLAGYRWQMVVIDTLWGAILFAVFAAVFSVVVE